MAKILLALQDMQVLIHILGMSNQGEMILSVLAMWYYIYLKELCHGRVFQVKLKQKSMPISRKRKKKSKLRSSVKVYQRSSKNL
jgi:hypothetical protein